MTWTRRAAVVLICVLVGGALYLAVSGRAETARIALGMGGSGAEAAPDQAAAPPSPILWSADFETGDFSQWEAGDGGGIFNTGTGVASVTSGLAHGGHRAAKLSISDAAGSAQAVRLFRWAESEAYPQAYYSVWLYFPRRYEPEVWWNVFQFKSRTETLNEPVWEVVVGNRRGGEMFFYLFDSINRQAHSQTRLNVPVGRWVHLEAYYNQSTEREGGITLWQDGVLLFDLDNVQTAIGDTVQWSVNNYTDDITPSTVTIYADDAAVSRRRLGPGEGGTE